MAKKNGAFPNFSTYITNIVLLLHYNYLKALVTTKHTLTTSALYTFWKVIVNLQARDAL